MFLEPGCNFHGAGVLPLDSQIKGFHAAQQQVRRKRVKRCTRDFAVMVDLLHQFLAATNNAAKSVRMTAQKLAGRMQHNV